MVFSADIPGERPRAVLARGVPRGGDRSSGSIGQLAAVESELVPADRD